MKKIFQTYFKLKPQLISKAAKKIQFKTLQIARRNRIISFSNIKHRKCKRKEILKFLTAEGGTTTCIK